MSLWRCGAFECALCYSGRKGRKAYRGHFGYRASPPVKGKSLMSVLKKRDKSVPGPGTSVDVEGGGFGKAYPGLWEFMTSARYADGSPRVPGTLTLFVDAGSVKGCLNDRDQSLTGWASATTVDGLLEALEAGLTGDSLDWRPSGQKKFKR